MWTRGLIWAALAAVVTLGLADCGARPAERDGLDARAIAAAAGSLGEAGLARLQAGMGAAGLIADRFDPAPHPDAWRRQRAWAKLDLASPPALPFVVKQADAQAMNAFLPVGADALTPAAPFILRTAGAERARAVLCMAQAIYYEAALEPQAGQEAVAQTVLNRLRHPDFPKSVCGVVYEGSSQALSCAFTFTCDGSLARAPIEPYWSRAKAEAEAALNGFVQKDVGSATYYHADYVFPRWGPQMVKIGQIGAHIFYRFPGPLGRADALSARYLGGELRVSMAGPSPAAIAAARAAEGTGAPPPAQVAATPEPISPTDLRPRVAGQIVFGRRIASHDEIADINARLAKLGGDPAPAGANPVPVLTPPSAATAAPGP
jgi:spore germination cell wall hydrolase CwlJ-like protein